MNPIVKTMQEHESERVVYEMRVEKKKSACTIHALMYVQLWYFFAIKW